MTETPERKAWIDIARGLGIIAVVAGHSNVGGTAQYIYWFHMPVFFVLSGYLFKPCADWMEFRQLVRKDTRQLLLPYFSFLLLTTVCTYAWIGYTWPAGSINFSADIISFLLGGRFLEKWYAPFWFITCLYVTRFAFACICIKFSSKRARLIVIALAYVLAHAEAQADVLRQAYIPWDMDVALITIAYFAFGYFARSVLENRNIKVLSLSALLAAFFVISQKLGFMDYHLNLKYLGYNSIILDLIIPLTLTVGLCQISHWLENARVFNSIAEIGNRSLTIMYLHSPVNLIGQDIIGYGFIWFTLVGVTFPFLVSKYLLERLPISRYLFLGKKEPNHRVSEIAGNC